MPSAHDILLHEAKIPSLLVFHYRTIRCSCLENEVKIVILCIQFIEESFSSLFHVSNQVCWTLPLPQSSLGKWQVKLAVPLLLIPQR